jgi:glycerophosphoryl diester phosphodiesterase
VGVCYYADPLDHAGLARSAGADTLHPHWHNVRRDAVEEAHRAGLFVITWTVNEPEDALHLVGMGVDAIKTDYPGPIREALVRAGLR